MAIAGDSVVRLPDGRIGLRLAPREREVLGALVEDLAAILGEATPARSQAPLDEVPWDDEADAPEGPTAADPPADLEAGAGPAGRPAIEEAPGPADEPDPVTVDPVLRRLYPDARPDDARASRRFRDLVRGDLDDDRRAEIAVVEATLDARSIDDAQAGAWLRVVNAVRLVLGTRLGVTEEADAVPFDADDPDAGARLVFEWAGWLEEQLVDVLAAALPDVVEPGDEPADPDDEAMRADDS